jgi:transposase
VELERVNRHDNTIQVTARAPAHNAACPACGARSARVHSWYQRHLTDTPVGGHQVRLTLRVCRLFCQTPTCPKRTFAQQVPDLTVRYGRRTRRLTELLAAVALALAGRAGARLAETLPVTISRMTLLRLVKALPDPPIATPRVLGVDDFALRRGNRYGTILLDMATHRPIDVLPDRTADTLAGWLTAHPGVEVVCRDRAGAYADGIRAGAPQARQVADRWHLWSNLGQALDKAVRAHRACLREPPEEPPEEVVPTDTPTGATAAESALQRELLDAHGHERPLVARTQERYAEVQALRASGASLNAISRTLGLAFRTTRRFATATSVEELLVGACYRATVLDAFKPYLTRRWNQGHTNAAQLHVELQAQGWKGSLRTVQGYLRPFRAQQATPAAPTAAPKPRHVVTWIMSDPDNLDPEEQVRLKKVLARCPELEAAAGQVREFAKMMTQRRGRLLEEWITATTAGGEPHLAGFAEGLRRDQAAVTAGLSLPYSSGAVEGAVNKVKMIKRKMFGRAGFGLLRKMVLLS